MKGAAALVLGLTTLTGAAQAQGTLERIERANHQIVAYLPDLQSGPLALNLKKAATRGVKVFVLAPRQSHLSRGSFLLSVALAGAETPPLPLSYHFARLNTAPFIAIDGQFAFAGSGVPYGNLGAALGSAQAAALTNLGVRAVRQSPPVPAATLLKERYARQY